MKYEKLLLLNTVGSAAILLTQLLVAPLSHASSVIEFEVPLVVNDVVAGDINARIIETTRASEKTTRVEVPIPRLAKLIDRFAITEQKKAWFSSSLSANSNAVSSQQVDIALTLRVEEDNRSTLSSKAKSNSSKTETDQVSDSSIDLRTLRQRGLDIAFDASSLSIFATVPRLGVEHLSLAGNRIPIPSNSYQPAKLASGLNFVVRNSIRHRSGGNGETGLGDTNVNVFGFTSFGGFGGLSLFYQGDYLENDDEREFARQNVVLIKDSFKHGIRYSLGDFIPAVPNLQTSPELLGLNIERNYTEINPFRNLSVTGNSSFVLERDSRVSFEVNGSIVETRDLRAGRYSVSDFPLIVGANNVRVYADDGVSQVEIANFSAFSDIRLLAPGIKNFGVSLGVLRDPDFLRSRRYESDPVLLGFYEQGLNDRVTVGAGVQVSETNALVSSNLVYGNRFGLFGIDVAVSERDDLDTGVSTSLRHSYDYITSNGSQILSDLQLGYRSREFGNVDSNSLGDEEWSLISSIGYTTNGYSLSLNGDFRRADDSDTATISALLSRSINDYNFSFGYTYQTSDNFPDTSSFSVNITKRFGGGNLQGQYRSSENEYRLGFTGGAAISANGISLGQASILQNDLNRELEFDANYSGSRFVLDIDHNERRSRVNPQADVSITGLRARASIGYANGKFAYGRPFTDSFVVLHAHKNLKGKRVGVRRGTADGDLITTIKGRGTTLIPVSSSYNNQRFVFEVDDLPIGYDLGEGEINLFPGFLTGYTYRLGTDAANTLIGNVLWPDGTPPSLIAGKMVSKESGDEITVFTNRTGRFVAERARFGEYFLEFNDGQASYRADVTVEETNQPGLVRLGTISLEKVQ